MKEWINVDSSTIKRVQHFPTVNKLRVEFQCRDEAQGKVAEYDGVDQKKFDAFINSPSKGKHFNTHIKSNKAHTWRYL